MSRSEQPVAPRLRPDNPAARAATRASQHGADHEGGAHRPVRMHPRSYPHPHRRPLPGAQRCWRARARRARPPGGPVGARPSRPTGGLPRPSDRGPAPHARPRARRQPARPAPPAPPVPSRPPRPARPLAGWFRMRGEAGLVNIFPPGVRIHIFGPGGFRISEPNQKHNCCVWRRLKIIKVMLSSSSIGDFLSYRR